MPRRGFWINPTHTARHLRDNEERRIQICRRIDRSGFNWQVWAVAGSGFFTDSYNLFATNVILPSLAFIYWTSDVSHSHETTINAVTLAGSCVGQLVFGFLADKYGRRKLYGIELIIVIIGTIGVCQSSSGVDGSMSIMGWILFYRLLMGIGIGGEYPLSAVITAEFAPTRSRARMMAAVFLMQPLGQLAAHLVGLFVVLGVGRARGLPALTAPEDHDAAAAIVDSIWRCVIGVGAFPALVAIIFRLTIPESPRFTLDVEYDANRALLDTQTYYKSRESVDFQDNAVEELGTLRNPALTQADADGRESITESLSVHSARAHSISLGPHQLKPHHASQFSREDIHQYFWVEGNWRHLAGTSLCWFFLDFAFYGLGINNPRVIAKIWTSSPLPLNANSTPAWGSDYSLQDGSIYDILKQNAIQSIITVSIGSVLGSLILIKAINYIPRKSILAWSFLGLAALLAITGGTFFKAFHSNLHALTITFYVLCQLLFNLGPNTLTFILPAEIFPTRYRCTCHGIAAAAGKLGSVLVLVFLPHVDFNGVDVNSPNSNGLGWVLVIFSGFMALGAVFAWAWIPNVQNVRTAGDSQLPSKTLEELAVGRIGVVGEAAELGFRKKTMGVWKRVRWQHA